MLSTLLGNADVEEVFQEKTHLLNEVKNEVSTPEKVAKLIKQNPWIFYAAGRKVFVDFGKYPKMDVTGYDSIHGEGSAERRLNSYQVLPSAKRFNNDDSYLLPKSTYVAPFYVERFVKQTDILKAKFKL
jgi:hypothetical protein